MRSTFRGTRFTAVVAVVLALLTLLSCSTGTQAHQPPKPVVKPSCGELANIVADPRGQVSPGVRLGPLHLTETWRDHFSPSLPTKVLIANVDPVTKPTTLKGERCSDQARLRFWINKNDLPFAQGELPVSPERLGNTGDLEVVLEPHWARVIPGGYMMFNSAGRWRLWTTQGDQVVASATIQVG
jgi:hypothetical protein